MSKLRKSGSWKTTAAGLAGMVGVVCGGLAAAWDGDPLTNADWGVIAGVLATQIGLLFARDDDKSSEEVGAKGR